MMDRSLPYSLVLYSAIPVVRDGEGYSSLDLWVVDLLGQLRETPRLRLIAPVVDHAPQGWHGRAPLPSEIDLVPQGKLLSEGIDHLLVGYDVVQVHGGAGWFDSSACRRLIKAARRLGMKSIVGISSDRSRTALLNAKVHGVRDIPRALKAVITFISQRVNYESLTAQADGTFIVGEGVRPLVSRRCSSLHVGVASWVKAADIERARESRAHADDARMRRACIASRLERMKGVHVGIEAMSHLTGCASTGDVTLTILGSGPEQSRLVEQVRDASLSERVTFGGSLAYPQPFLRELQRHGVVILPNLNDEQPRLIFDAISQACVPICPRTPAYTALGLPAPLLYKVGDSRSLARAYADLLALGEERAALWAHLFDIASRWTLESMHGQRADWIKRQILGRPGAVAPTCAV